MCSNTGQASLSQHSRAELIRRAETLVAQGFRRVVVTGGEATIHPDFWELVEFLRSLAVHWDINTHGRSFSAPHFTSRAIANGLQRAIVSLHSFDPTISAEIFGADELAHHETVRGIDELLQHRIPVLVNCVLSRKNLETLDSFLLSGIRRWGRRAAFKFVFPSTTGKGGRWSPIADLTLQEAQQQLIRIRELSVRRSIRTYFESVPCCITGDPQQIHFGRSTFGESHYLDDRDGSAIYAMRSIEAELAAYAPACATCPALPHCPGLPLPYAKRFGTDELSPFLNRPPSQGT